MAAMAWDRTPPIGEKNGTKRHVLVEGDGGPLAVVVDGANRHDSKLLEPTLAAVVSHPAEPLTSPPHLCLDKAYDSARCEQEARDAGFTPHLRRIGEEVSKRKNPKKKARRWVVERTHAWLHRWRGILVRYEKKATNYEAMLHLACALLWYRRLWSVGAF